MLTSGLHTHVQGCIEPYTHVQTYIYRHKIDEHHQDAGRGLETPALAEPEDSGLPAPML